MLGSIPLFYGFMRYALRTLSYSAPVKHPIIGSVALKLSQLHKDEVDRLLDGNAAPWAYGRIFFSSHSPASVLTHGNLPGFLKADKVPGRDHYSLDLDHVSPTQTPLTDIATEGRKAWLSPFLSPLAQSILNLAYGKDLFTNQDIG